MTSRTIKVSSRALGRRETVRVVIYDTVAEMHAAARRFNDMRPDVDCVAVTQTTFDRNDPTYCGAIIRLVKPWLTTEAIVHEMHHATAAIYGATIDRYTSVSGILTHDNEPFAYLHSDLVTRLIARLFAYGYYGQKVTLND